MKNRNIYWTILIMLTFTLNSCNEAQVNMSVESSKNLIVLVKYKTQPSKSEEAIESLTKLIEEVKHEPNFMRIRLHVDQKDKTNILLYEEWSDEAYYTGDHMKTPHLQNFMVDSRNFLAGPPEISQWNIVKDL